MRKTLSLLILLSSVFTLSAREKISINEGWSFSKSISTGAAVDQFARYGGRVEKVNLPHTWNASDFMSTEGVTSKPTSIQRSSGRMSYFRTE